MRIVEVIRNFRLFLENPLVARTRAASDIERRLQWVSRYFYEAYITEDGQVFYVTSEGGFRELHRVDVGEWYAFQCLVGMPYNEVQVNGNRLDILGRDYPNGEGSKRYAKNLGKVLTQLGEF